MIIKNAKYIASFTETDKCPSAEIPEFAFIGRSNVGKSSLINMLVNSKNLVKVSETPGKTQTINYFLINDGFHFVDLPGYGFARVSQKERENWRKMIESYLTKRRQLLCVFILIDSRHEPQKIDINFINHLGEWQVPFVMVFTKTDKISRNECFRNMGLMKEELEKNWESLPSFYPTSSVTRTGREEMLELIENLLEQNS